MQTDLIKITGMTCGGCTSKLTRALQAVAGVTDVTVSLQPGEAKVQYDELLASPARLESAVKAAGFGVGDTTSTPTSAVPPKGGSCH